MRFTIDVAHDDDPVLEFEVYQDGKPVTTRWSLRMLAGLADPKAVGKAFAIVANRDGRVTFKDLSFKVDVGEPA